MAHAVGPAGTQAAHPGRVFNGTYAYMFHRKMTTPVVRPGYRTTRAGALRALYTPYQQPANTMAPARTTILRPT